MLIRAFTVHDDKAMAFLPPFFYPAVGEAIRAFIDASLTTDHRFNKHATDYTLYSIGYFDDQKGTLEPATAEAIGRADIMRSQFLETQKGFKSLEKHAKGNQQHLSDLSDGQKRYAELEADLVEAAEGKSNGEQIGDVP